jgi:integrase
VLVFTGLRVSEALALRWKDIDLLGGVLHVRHSLNRDGTLGEPKTDAGRRDVPLSDALVGLLLNLKPEDAADDHFVFATKDDPTRPLSYRNFERRGFRPAVTAAGLDGNGLTIHSLRHAAASWLIASGMSAVDVASVLGHADSSITLRVYASLFDGQAVADRVRAAQQALLDPVEREAA